MLSATKLNRGMPTLNYQQHRISAQQMERAEGVLFLPKNSPSPSDVQFVQRLSLEPVEDIPEATTTTRTPRIPDHACTKEKFTQMKCTKDLVDSVSDSSNFKLFKIHQQQSYSCVDITREMFEALCAKCGVFPKFKDMVIYLGLRDCELEVAPPRPRYRWLEKRASSDLELTYGLRWIEENGRSSVWSLRQSVIYHKLENIAQKSTWIVVAPTVNAGKDVEEFIQSGVYKDIEQQFALHAALVQSSIDCWRPYSIWLAQQVGRYIRDIKFANPKDAQRWGPDYVDLAKTGTRLALKVLEDLVNDALLALRGNQDVLESMQKLFTTTTHANGEEGPLDEFLFESLRDITMLRKQLKNLQEKLDGCTKIASSFSDLAIGESLQKLSEAAQEEIKQTTELTRRAQKDAAAVKALTVIASIFLPTTVVLNFFSASFIDTSRGEIVLVGKWWLFLVVSVPLTIVTICVWQFWVRRQQPDQAPENGADLEEAGLRGQKHTDSRLKVQ